MSVEKTVKGATGPRPATSSAGARSIENADVFRVGVKVPPFWAEEPDIWFAQVEGQFSISGITSDVTKFNYVIGHLDNLHSREVKDIIVNPPPTEKYEKLKSELIKRLSASKENKIKQLLMHEELGDRKPSQFLRHLQSLAGLNVPDDFLRTIWISRLPHGIQTVLAGQASTASLENLADLADRVNDLASSTPKVTAVSEIPGSVVSDLVKQVAECAKKYRDYRWLEIAEVIRVRERTVHPDSDHSQTTASFQSAGTTINSAIRLQSACAHVITSSRKTRRAVDNGD